MIEKPVRLMSEKESSYSTKSTKLLLLCNKHSRIHDLTVTSADMTATYADMTATYAEMTVMSAGMT